MVIFHSYVKLPEGIAIVMYGNIVIGPYLSWWRIAFVTDKEFWTSHWTSLYDMAEYIHVFFSHLLILN